MNSTWMEVSAEIFFAPPGLDLAKFEVEYFGSRSEQNSSPSAKWQARRRRRTGSAQYVGSRQQGHFDFDKIAVATEHGSNPRVARRAGHARICSGDP